MVFKTVRYADQQQPVQPVNIPMLLFLTELFVDLAARLDHISYLVETVNFVQLK